MTGTLTQLSMSVTPANEAVIQSFQLTPEELIEVEALATRLNELIPVQKEELQTLAKTTKNAGIQYLLMEDSDLVRFVVNSRQLDPRVVSPFLDRLIIGDIQGIPSGYSLLVHKVVVGDVKLFKQAWETVKTINAYPLSRSPESLNDFDNLYYALNFHSIAEGNNANAMSIETLLLIMAHLHRQEKHGIDPTLGALRAKVLRIRGAEIKAWVSENMPDLVGLPLSWVLEVYDLYD